MIDNLALRHIKPAESTLRTFNQQQLPTRGMVTVEANNPSTKELRMLTFYITDCHRVTLLGIR